MAAHARSVGYAGSTRHTCSSGSGFGTAVSHSAVDAHSARARVPAARPEWRGRRSGCRRSRCGRGRASAGGGGGRRGHADPQRPEEAQCALEPGPRPVREPVAPRPSFGATPALPPVTLRDKGRLQMMTVLRDTIKHLEDDKAIKVVVIRHVGKVFSSGHDLKEINLQQTTTGTTEPIFTLCSSLMLAVRGARFPVIAEVDGLATAGGCQLVAACEPSVPPPPRACAFARAVACWCAYVCSIYKYICICVMCGAGDLASGTYTYIHTCIYTHMHVYIYTSIYISHMHIHISTYPHIHIYTYTHIHRCIYTYMHVYTSHMHIHIYTYTHIHIYTYTHIHIYTYTHIHIYTYTHIHIYTYLCMQAIWPWHQRRRAFRHQVKALSPCNGKRYPHVTA